MQKLIFLFLFIMFIPSPLHAQVQTNFSSGGALRVGTSTTTCNAAAAGVIRYNTGSGGSMESCNGTSWGGIGGSTSGLPTCTTGMGLLKGASGWQCCGAYNALTVRDTTRGWWGIASSADGTKLVAVVYNGNIYTSTNSGVSWTARDSARKWYGVASSADGTKLVAGVDAGNIYTSTDSGVTWTARGNSGSWINLASSSDGLKLVAGDSTDGQIYFSNDSGASWQSIGTSTGTNLFGAAMSSDGTKLVINSYNGPMYTTTHSTCHN